MTRDTLARYTGLSARKLDKHLTALVDRGVLGVDTDGASIEWTVRGKPRDLAGAETLERFERVERLRAEARAKVARQAENRRRRRAGLDELSDHGDSTDAESDSDDRDRRGRRDRDDSDDSDDGESRSMIRAGAGLAKGALGLVAAAAAPLDSREAKGKKSLLLSGGLSLLGPLGWLYAGSFREAVPASLLYLGIAALLPRILLTPVLLVALPLSALVGMVYAWQHNSNGQRTPLFLDGGDKNKTKKKDKS